MKVIISTLLITSATIMDAQSVSIAATDSIKPVHKNIAKFKISDVYIQPGLLFLSSPTGSLGDFKTLAPQSVLLKQDLSGYSLDNGSGGSGGALLSMGMTIKFIDKKRQSYKANPKLQLGFSCFSGDGLSRYLSKTVVDSVNGTADTGTKYTTMDYEYTQVFINASLIFSTNDHARVSVYGGIGIRVGITVKAYTYISAGDSVLGTNNTEVFRNKIGAPSYSLFIPGGVDFRIGNKSKFWNHVHLFFDFSLVGDAVVIPNLTT